MGRGSGTSADINYLRVIKSTPRRLSNIQNDDFIFHAHRQNQFQYDDTIDEVENTEPNTAQHSDNAPGLSNGVQFVEIDNEQIHKGGSQSDYHGQIWKYSTNNSIMRFAFMRTLRGKILLDLERHFGRKVMHDRLFSCLCK